MTGDQLGHMVGEGYVIHEQTANVLDNINKRLNEEEKGLRTYRRALAFSKILHKDLVPILLSSRDNCQVFDAVIRLLVNLTVPVECLCPLDTLQQSESGKQIVFELTSSLCQTKEVFRDSRTTYVITDWLGRIINQTNLAVSEVNLVNNCLLLIRNILHIPDTMPPGNQSPQRCSHQNQILWNLFAQNLDKILLDLIRHHTSDIWCTSVVQLIALVYKDQHVVTLQKLLQNFLESSLSESSEDNESNTSPHFQNGSGSCTPSTDDSSDQNCRETSTPELSSSSSNSESGRRNSCGSLEVLPNNSPAPSEESEQLNSASPSPCIRSPKFLSTDDMIQSLPTALNNIKRSLQEVDNIQELEEGNTNGAGDKESTSGIESEVTATTDSEPPKKVYISEDNNGDRVMTGKSPKHKTEYVHKIRSPKHSGQSFRVSGPNEKGGSGTDSSDISGVPKVKHPAKLPDIGSITDSTDYGYVTWEHRDREQEQENQEQNSSSSNDDDLRRNPRTNPVKPRAKNGSQETPAEKKERRRLKLLKRSRENRMRVKAMVNHVPSDDDISELLKEFTVDFLHHGYQSLVCQILVKLSRNESNILMDKSHFLWLLTYFLKFASQLEIGIDLIGKVVSFETLSYVTYEGVDQIETLELANRGRKEDLGPILRRIHLVVTALREFLQTVASYREKNLSPQDVKHIETLRVQSLYAKECRQLLVILLRRFNPQHQSLQYLTDLVICNHMLLLDLEIVSDNEQIPGASFNLTAHIKQFANAEMMRQFGRLLEEYEKNPPYVNDCIFTIMHHIAGDLDSPQTLYVPSILKSFSKIWEQGLQICEDWVDLIEFIIQKFIQTMGNSRSATNNVEEYLDYNDVVDEQGFTLEQASQLFWHFTQVENSKDPVGAIIQVYKQSDNTSLSRLAVIQALLSNGIITHAQYMSFMYMKNEMSACKNQSLQGSVKAEVGSEHCNSDGHITDSEETGDSPGDKNKNSEIQVLKDCLVRQGKESLIPWLQEVLLDACRVKMYPNTLIPEDSKLPHEPIPYYYNKAKQSIPLVPWNRNHYLGLQTEAFILLLHKLGFHLPADVGKVFPRIPHFWSADHIFTVAMKIGPIDTDKLKFSQEELEMISKRNSEEVVKKDADKTLIDEIEDVGSGFESMDLDLLNVSPSGQPKLSTESGAWLNLAQASKQQDVGNSSKDENMDFE